MKGELRSIRSVYSSVGPSPLPLTPLPRDRSDGQENAGPPCSTSAHARAGDQTALKLSSSAMWGRGPKVIAYHFGLNFVRLHPSAACLGIRGFFPGHDHLSTIFVSTYYLPHVINPFGVGR